MKRKIRQTLFSQGRIQTVWTEVDVMLINFLNPHEPVTIRLPGGELLAVKENDLDRPVRGGHN